MAIWQTLKQRFDNLSGAWLVVLAAVAWSSAGAVVKSFDTHPLLLVGTRSLIGGLALAALIRPQKIVFDRWLLFTIICYATFSLVAMTTLRLTAAVVVIAMQYTAPVWIFLVGWIFKKQYDKKRIVVMALICVAMILFLVFPVPGSAVWGNWLSLMMGVLFALISVCLKKVRHNNPIGVIAICNLGTAALVLPLCFIIPGIPLHIGPTDWLLIAYLAVFQLSAGYVFYTLGIKKLNPQKATLLSMWEFILTPLWAFIVVREMPTLIVWLACALLVAALVWDNRLDSLKPVESADTA